jgi:hypothetical protein
MTDISDLPIPSPVPHQQIAAFAGPPPLIAGERAAGYDDLLARVTETLQPSDVLEHIWIRDIVDLTWEVFRLRRLKVGLMSAAAWEGMAKVMEPWVDHPEATSNSRARGDYDTVAMVDAALVGGRLTMDHVAARTFSARIGDFERIARMAMAAEAGRNAALHELDLHRASFALRLRRTLQAVEDVEFEVVAPAEPAQGSAAEAEAASGDAAGGDAINAEAA